MENKKHSLSTVFLIITLFIIAIMGVCIYKQRIELNRQIATITELEDNINELQEKINDSKLNTDSISNTINDKNNISSNEKNSKQFDVEFYELKDVAREYREYQDVKNYKDFIYDLDGDGTTEKITLSLKNDDVESKDYSVKLNGEIFSEGTSMDSIYIVDLNEKDNNIEVVVFDDGPSDDPNYTIYTKSGNKMIELKNISGYPFKTDKKGMVLVGNVYSNAINPKIYFEYYIIQNGKIEVKKIDIEKIEDLELKTSYLYFTEDYKNVNKIFDENVLIGENIEANLQILNIEQLKENITFRIKGFTIEENFAYDGLGYKIFVELSDGRKGYIFHIQMAG